MKKKNGDTVNHQTNLPPSRGVGYLCSFFKDAYFPIPIQEQSRKYLRYHVQGWAYQLKALLFGLSAAVLEFTVVTRR